MFCNIKGYDTKTKIPSFTEGWGNKKTTKTKKERKGFSRDPCANIFNK